MKTIRQNLKTHLSALGIQIHTSRVRPVDIRDLPCLVIYNKSSKLDNLIPNNLYLGGDESVTISIDAVLSMNGEFADALDDLVQSIIQQLSDKTFLDENFNTVDSIEVDYQYVDGLEKPLAVASITIYAKTFRNYN